MASRIVITLPLPKEALAAIAGDYELAVWDQPDPMPQTTLHEWLAGADGVLCSLGTSFSAETINAFPNLKVVSSISVGVDHIDLGAATAQGLPIGHTPGVLVDSTADMALALMLATTRRIAEADRFMREGGWQTGWDAGFFLGTDLSRARVGLVGMGPIGQAVARRLQGFGAEVIAWNRTPRDVPGVKWVELNTLFAEADIISLHTALTPETAGIVGAGQLAAMRDGAVLINTARGGLVDEPSLIAELMSGRLRAGLDVFAEEPPPVNSPLFALDNVVLAPHLGSATAATRRAMLELALHNLIAGVNGQPLPHCANREVYGDT